MPNRPIDGPKPHIVHAALQHVTNALLEGRRPILTRSEALHMSIANNRGTAAVIVNGNPIRLLDVDFDVLPDHITTTESETP